jgi:phenylacetic acid degradation protein
MAIYEFEGRMPQIGKDAYIHPASDIIGKVTIGDGCWVGPGARLRGDYGEIVVGEGTSIEENCVVHARPGGITRIGKRVTIGHGAVVHNATIHDYAVVGMSSVVSDWAVVGKWAVVGEGAVVKQRQEIPSGHIAVGVPAKVVGQVKPEYKEQWTNFKGVYPDLARRYPKGLKELDRPT